MLKKSAFSFVFFLLFSCYAQAGAKVPIAAMNEKNKDYQEYVSFFKKVFKTVQDNYYQKPDQKSFDQFIKKFNAVIYPQLKGEGKSNDYVRWRSSWFLVDSLKTKDDRFSQFYPPKPAVKFQKEALGQLIDLGLEGKKVDAGFLITRIEPRSDSYVKGMRQDDILLFIDGVDVKNLTQEQTEAKLNPLINTKVKLLYLGHEDRLQKTVEVLSQEYFKQTVFLHEVQVPGVFCLEIPKFNRTTGEDLFRFLQLVEKQNPRGLVLDLRGNPGGPPLAAREISAFFLKGGDDFAYFQRRNPPDKLDLDVPVVDDQYQYKGPIVILVDQDSGSATELFTGIMQFRGRAAVMGTNTAGQVLLKSMFPLDDGSMVALVTARGYYPDGTKFSFDGITPDKIINGAPKDGLINLAAAYILMNDKKK